MPDFATENTSNSDDEFEIAFDFAEEADIDIFDLALPDAQHFAPAQWSDDRYDVIRGARGMTYEGHARAGLKEGPGKLWDAARAQYIDGEWRRDKLVALNFAQFQINDTDFFRLNGLDELITSNKHHFVARINIQSLNILCNHFPDIRREIESRITITKILDDDLKNELQLCRERFESMLKLKQNAVTTSRRAQRDMFHLFLLNNEMETEYDYEGNCENINVLKKISDNTLFSQELRKEAKDACIVEQNVYTRNRCLPIMKLTEIKFSWKTVIKGCINDSIRCIKIALQHALPNRAFIHSGPEDIDKLKLHQLFTCSIHDIQLFSDLEFTTLQHSKSELLVTNFHNFTQMYVSQLWVLLFSKIINSELPDIPDESVYTNSVFLQLVKTFLELLDTICRESGQEVKRIVTITTNSDIQMIEYPERNLGIYEHRLQFLINLMNHFKPGDVKKYKFKYNFFFFKENEQWFKQLAGFVNRFNNSLINIAQEYAIWLFYVHSSFSNLFCEEKSQDNDSKNKLFSFLNSLMNLFKTVISNQEMSLEKVRILANSVIQFGTTISPYFLEQTPMNAEDISLLLKQAEYIKDFVTANEHALDDITNIVDTYQVFWDERKNLFTAIREKYSTAIPSITVLLSKFKEFVEYVFNIKIYTNKFLIFLRAISEFIRLLRGTNFPWYVNNSDLLSNSFVKIIDEKTHSYLVKNTEGFLQEFFDTSKDPPCHYLFHVAVHFMDCAQKFLNRNDWNVNDKIQACSDLLMVMGRSLINFKKLPNAVDFNHFFAIFTDPFDRVTKNSNVNDFKKRLDSLESYYKYTIELNVISISKALEQCRQNIHSCHSEINYSFETSILESCYNVYLKKFNTYVDKYILQTNFNIKHITDKVISKVKSTDINKWDSEYKKTKLPKILAGISAVWSALESKDIICQKQVMKPHCIQILCILRLLGVDQEESGFKSHLAQVLTGQGKSIILSLLAAILALTGNRVRIVCYNEYLANRDKNNFQAFFKTFEIEDKINYGTFDDMANEILIPEIKGTNYKLTDFVFKLITNELPRLYVKEEKNIVTKTVLLIDEVDVFFSPEFYGNTFNQCIIINSEALGVLQIKIWNLTEHTCAKDDIRENIQKYIDEEFPQSTDSTFVQIVRNSRTILNSHVDEMISNAIDVRNSFAGAWYYRKYKLRDDGLIIIVADNGEHKTTSYYRYNNAFMYFKLKRNNYDHKGFKNYGYLNISCGNISYAMLPTDYQSIIGVTGTLNQLFDVEMRAVTSYNIVRGSDMPTFFGSSKLSITNFTIKDTTDAWITAILDSILSYVEKERAVIVFFDNEQTIDTLRSKFTSHLSRYSVLTGNESAEEMVTCVEEAGVTRKVTIATRRMGRGVDFKSNDSAVESKGGIHVIQAFWSENVREETQIKGRTARKDNNGTYEAILCREHLTKTGYEDTVCSYEELNEARARRAEERGTQLTQNIQKSKQKHDATMDFLRSFYNYDPNNRYEYFQKYPFIDIDLK